MNSVSVLFSLLLISLNIWFFSCVSESGYVQMFSEENTQFKNMYIGHSGMAANDGNSMDYNGRRNVLSGADISSRRKRELNLQSYLRSSIGDLRSDFMFSMGSNRGGRNGHAITFGNNAGIKNGMMYTTSHESPGNGMRAYGSTSTNENERMQGPIGIGSGFNSQIGSSLPMDKNFNSDLGTSMNNGNIFRNGMENPMENNKAYQFGSGMTPSNHETPMGTGFNGNVGIDMPINGNTGWNPPTNIGNNAPPSMQSSFGTGVNNNMKVSGSSNMARGSNIMP